MHLSIIIVTWNSKDRIGRCVQSIAPATKGIQAETMVIDNASTDGTAETVRDKFPWVKLVRFPRNMGFAHACNVGITRAQGEYIGFLNPDAEVLANGFTHLIHFMHTHPRGAAAGGKLLNADYTVQPSVHVFPTPLSAFGVAAKLHRLPLFSRFVRGGFESGTHQASPRTVDYVKGAFFVARKSFLDEVGGFDERYFLWFDEVDLMRSARARGWEVWYYPKAQALHIGAASFLQADGWRNQRQFLKSMGLYLQKWHGRWGALPVRLITPIILTLHRLLKR